MVRYRVLSVAAVLAAFVALTAVASADHPWNGYHWPSDHLSPTVVNKASSPLYNVPAGVSEWATLGAPIQPALVNAKRGDITVSEGFSIYWLGLARIYLEGGHITKGEVKLNTRLLRSYGAAAADHVLCQEIGHVLGLDHNRDGAIGGTPDDSCMNDQGHLGQYTTPNQHDLEQLNAIYNHVDGAAQASATSRSGNGVWITVHVFPAP